jgi:two-component system, NarL family, response regulator DevR
MPSAAHPTSCKKILVVDDSALVRAGLISVLETSATEDEFCICGEAASGTEAMEQVRRLEPDLVLLDVRLPDGHGYDVCRTMLSEYPETRVIMLTAFTNDNFIYESITAGAQGYLMKEIEPAGLIASIRDVLAGKSVLSDKITNKVMEMMRTGKPKTAEASLHSLSAQETRVLQLVAEGRTNREVADQMKLSGNTVKNYLGSVFGKLKIRNRSQAVALWIEHQGKK